MSKKVNEYKARLSHTYETKTFLGHVVLDPETKRKRVKIDYPKYYDYEVNKFNVGDEVSIHMTNKRPKRTVAQNRYLHLYCHLIGEASGHSMEEIKTWAKGKFLSEGITEVFGDKVRVVKETSKMNVSEFMEFIARIEVVTEIPAPDTAPFKIPMTHEEYKVLRDKQRAQYRMMQAKIIP